MSEQHFEIDQTSAAGANSNISVERLSAIMDRIGCTTSPDKFLESVARAYRQGQRSLRISDAAFDALSSHEVFIEGLKEASLRLKGGGQIMVLGCGDDFVGRDATYAEELVRKVIPREKMGTVRAWNLARSDLRVSLPPHHAGRYDLIVTNSLLHFIADIGCVVRLIAGMVGERGLYLMGHEPNSRFWFNQTLREERRCMAIETIPTWRQRALRLSSYRVKIRKLFRARPPVTLGTLVNRSLTDQYGLRGEVANHEIARIVDPHRPCEVGGGLQIGLNGFGVEELAQFWNRSAAPVWMRSYDHLGFIDYPGLPEKWKKRDLDLEKLYPHDGSAWAALWGVAEPT
jgi:hypothetical protein